MLSNLATTIAGILPGPTSLLNEVLNAYITLYRLQGAIVGGLLCGPVCLLAGVVLTVLIVLALSKN